MMRLALRHLPILSIPIIQDGALYWDWTFAVVVPIGCCTLGVWNYQWQGAIRR